MRLIVRGINNMRKKSKVLFLMLWEKQYIQCVWMWVISDLVCHFSTTHHWKDCGYDWKWNKCYWK